MPISERPEEYGCVILAAGLGRRFGGGKLLAQFDGQPLYRRVMDAVPVEARGRTAVVSGDADILAAAAERGYRPVENLLPEAGISRSIRRGLEALEGCAGVLFMVGDQPLLRRETTEALLTAARENPGCIVAPVRSGGKTGNPCFFPARFFPELLALEGDTGGRRVMAAHPEAVVTLPVSDRELTDTDSPQALAALESRSSSL